MDCQCGNGRRRWGCSVAFSCPASKSAAAAAAAQARSSVLPALDRLDDAGSRGGAGEGGRGLRRTPQGRAPIDEVVRAAAASDPEITGLYEQGKAQRLAGQRELLRIVAGPRGLRAGLGEASAVDTLYAVGSPETYRLLTVDRGWSAARFERWYADTLARLLFDG
ncbi:MAG: hypothetical protein ACRDG7_14990 [Candidatus Limnocylindria bacterium]